MTCTKHDILVAFRAAIRYMPPPNNGFAGDWREKDRNMNNISILRIRAQEALHPKNYSQQDFEEVAQVFGATYQQ